jgi:hypothetical protein
VDWSLQLEDPVSWAWMCLQKIFQTLNTGVQNVPEKDISVTKYWCS